MNWLLDKSRSSTAVSVSNTVSSTELSKLWLKSSFFTLPRRATASIELRRLLEKSSKSMKEELDMVTLGRLSILL